MSGLFVILVVGALIGVSLGQRTSLPGPADVVSASEPVSDSPEVQHLKARIADCQNEIYSANNSVWQLNFEIIQYKSAGDSISILQTQKQVESEFGKTLCFEDGTTQYNQSDALNKSQQQELEP